MRSQVLMSSFFGGWREEGRRENVYIWLSHRQYVGFHIKCMKFLFVRFVHIFYVCLTCITVAGPGREGPGQDVVLHTFVFHIFIFSYVASVDSFLTFLSFYTHLPVFPSFFSLLIGRNPRAHMMRVWVRVWVCMCHFTIAGYLRYIHASSCKFFYIR